MRRVLVVVVVLLAGCSGVFADGGRSESAPVTPAPVPSATTAPFVLPQTADGRPAVGRIIAAHRASLSTQAFHLRIVADGGQSTTDVWVDRERDVRRVRRVRGTSVDGAVVADGRRYEPAADGGLSRDSASRLPYVDSVSGVFVLQQRVAGLVYDRTGTLTRNGTTLAVLRANTTDSTISRSGFRTVVAANSTLYVDRNYVVRAMRHEERYADGTVRTLQFDVTTGGRVPLPEWYDDTASQSQSMNASYSRLHSK